MYPSFEPHASGLLRMDDGQRVYWEVAGNPDGIPAVYLHGGPGGTLKAGYRRKFDPKRLRVVETEGHGGEEMMELWRLATDSFARHSDFRELEQGA